MTAHADESDALTFSIRHGRDMYYDIHILRGKFKEVLQTISVRNGVDLTKPGSVELLDLNADGFRDLRLWGGGEGEKRWYKIWYYDVKNGKFSWSHTTDNQSGG